MTLGVARRLVRPIALAAVLVAIADPARAQSSSSLRGTVTDPSKSTVPGATVTLTNEATKFQRDTVTDAQGGYFFATIDPGTYTLKVELASFKTHEAKGVQIAPNSTAGLDVVLQLGDQKETVTVTAARELVQTRTGAREGLITAEEIERQSIVGRNPLELLRILPGVVANNDPANNEVSGMFTGASGEISINGVRSQNLGITLDGANLRDVGANSGTLNVPNNEFVQEVKVQSSNYAAEFGSSGVQVQALTKSGSSKFHGSAFDYIRPYQVAATDRSRSLIGQEKPKSEFQYPGFTASGPIVLPGFNKERNKAFFFFGFEVARQSVDEGTFLGYTPTAGQRQGLFNDYQGGQNLNQPTVVNIPGGFPGAGSPAPNNDLRPYIDPIGRALLNLYPLPNYNDPNNRYNYVFSQLRKENRNQFVLRSDYNLSESTRAYVRLARDKDDRQKFRGLWWNSSGVELPTPIADTSLGRSVVANVTSVLSPSATNEVIFTWSQLKNDNLWEDPSKVQLASYGIAGLTNPFGASAYIPQLVVNNFNTEGSLWTANDVDNIFSYNGFIRIGDSYTKLIGTHAIKAGVSFERQYKEQNFDNTANVRLIYAPWGNGSTGSDYADILTGKPAQAVIGTPSAIGNFVAWNIDAFAQDAWRLRRNITLEYGLRFGRWTNNVETNDLGAVFLPALYDRSKGLFIDAARQQANGVGYVRTGQVEPDLIGSRPLQWMPRANVAWDLFSTGATIVRGGGGLFFNREQGNAQYDILRLPPNGYAATLDAGALTSLGGGRGLTYTTLGQADPFSSLNGFNIASVNPDEKAWPRLWNASVSVAQRIPWKQTVDLSYVTSYGRHLAAQRQFNVIPVGGLSSGLVGNADLSNPLHRAALQDSVVNSLRPFPTLQDVNYFAPIGKSTYHALQATVSRAAGRFNYLVAYTLSRARGTVGNDFAPIDPLDPERSTGVMPFDRRQVLNVSWNWELPTPQGGRLAQAIGGGWNLAGISTFASGVPIRIGFNQGDLSDADMARAWWGTQDYANFDRGNGGIGDITPTYTCDPRLSGGSDVGDKVLDISCIGIPGFGETGPFRAPYDLRSPARAYHDLTIFKNIALGGDKRLQVRAGLFNIFNQAYPDYNQNDIDLNLATTCNTRVSGVPDGAGGTNEVCDPRGGFRFTDNTIQNFGKIITKRGHRIVEFAVRFFW